jgi:hypothetical protein
MSSQRAIQNGLFLIAFCGLSHAATLVVGPSACPSAAYQPVSKNTFG